MPIPGAPGTLSTLSPAKDCTSITLSGPTPNLSITSLILIVLFFIESYIEIPLPTNCIKSLSDETIVTDAPNLRAFTA